MRAAISVSDLTDYSDRLLAMQLALRGDFADEMAALKEQREALEADLKALGSKAAIAKKIADADAYAEKTKAEADAMTAQAAKLANQAADEARAAMDASAAAAKRESAISQAEARLSVRQAAFEADTAGAEATLASRDAALTLRQQAIERSESDLAVAQKQLIKDRADFNIRLDSLRT